jgi:pimeloyl-ACP methyl ester carboxylesterase
MDRYGRRLRVLALALIATASAGPGCMPFLHPVGPPLKEHFAETACLPQAARDHVHIFFIHGMDPFDWANLAGVREYLHALGYIKTHYGQIYHVWEFENDLRRVHQEDPDARFVLIGFSFGANMARNVAIDANTEHIPIDLLVYLGGNTLKDCPEDKPENALHIVNILATGCVWNGDHLEGADNLNYGDVWHFGSPSHPKTLDVLAEELVKVTARVQVVVHEPPPFVFGEAAPTPRPVVPLRPGPRDQWDFLKPAPPGELTPPPREMQKPED